MSELTLFRYGSHAVRSVLIDGEPWFMAGDVCAVLGISNVGNALARLDPDAQGSIRLTDGTPGNPNRAVVSEPGLYEMIIRSDKAGARPFRRWVTREVLPAIRRTGQYAAVPATYADALELAARQARALDAAALELEAARPAVEFHEQFVTGDGLYKIADVAKVLAVPGLGQNRLFEFLRVHGVLIRGGESHNSPYQRHVNAERFVVKVTTYPAGEGETGTSKTTYATPKGLAFVADLVARYGDFA